MAKTFGGLLSLDASGQFGGVLVFSKWKGVNYARLKVTPSNPKTALQMAVRAYLSAVGKITKKSNKSGTEVAFIKTKAPSGQSWNSFFGREMIGTGNVNFDAAREFYINASNATIKGYFDTAAATAGIEAVNLGTATEAQVAPGLALLAAYNASQRLGSTNAPVDAASVTQEQVTSYVSALI